MYVLHTEDFLGFTSTLQPPFGDYQLSASRNLLKYAKEFHLHFNAFSLCGMKLNTL